MDGWIQDARYGAKLLRRNPGVTGAAVLTLALGIGATTAIFSVVNGVLLRPLPYRDVDRVVTLWQIEPQAPGEKKETSPATYIDWRDRSRVFEDLVGVEPYSYDLVGEGEPEVFLASKVSRGFFEVLGSAPHRGRTFLTEEYRTGNVVVLSYGLWQRRFGGDPAILGRKLTFDEGPFTVVGVMPPEFRFPTRERELWAPRVESEEDLKHRGGSYIPVIARLKPGATIEDAQADMDRVAEELAREYPRTNKGVRVSMVPLAEQIVGEVRPALLLLLAAVGFVLLIGCANVAHLFLARGAERQQEFAIRKALGARPGRLLRQALTESLLLALAGAAAGLALTAWGIDAIQALDPGNVPRMEEVRVDSQVLLFTLGLTLLTALAFGIAPALQSAWLDPQRRLQEASRTATAGAGRRRARSFLVAAEVSLALVLLVGAGLLIRSFANLLSVAPGFVGDRVLALQVFVGTSYPKPEQKAAFFQDTLSRIAALPGVTAAGAVSALPFIESSIDIDTGFVVEGRPAPEAGEEPSAFVTIVTTDYHRALGIPLRRGRFFDARDDTSAPPVLLISETMARRYFPGEDPIGKKVTVRFGRPTAREIVGIVGDVLHAGLDTAPRPEVFIPHAQYPFGSMTFVVRTAGDPLAVLPAAKEAVRAVNPLQTFYKIATLQDLVSRSLASRRFLLLLLGAFASLALVLAAFGIYGVVSFTTAQRTHEIGIRMALGAEAQDIRRMIVGSGLAPTLAGVATGSLAAVALTRFLQSFLFEVSATDPLTFLIIAGLLAGVAMVAAYLPARRATRIDPIGALRWE